MNKYDKGKLKVLIKMILINESPKSLTSNQISSKINKYDWGFKTNITSAKISKLLAYELSKNGRMNHFMQDIKTKRGKNNIKLYSF